jgi:uncharacterized membrane protein
MPKPKNFKLEAKRANVLKKSNRKTKPVPIIFGLLVLLGAVAMAYYMTSGMVPAIRPQAAADPNGVTVSYPVSRFDDGRAHRFEFRTGDTTVRYFILKSSDGIIRAAFDACDVCWPAGKGYVQNGDDMVCRNCGRRFASVRVNEVKGGCNPAPLIRTVRDDQLIINVGDIIKGQSYFNFKGKA